MGSRNSKQPEPPAVVEKPQAVVEKDESKEESSPEKEKPKSGCPMHQADGSYSYDWRALFRRDFPHGPGGSRPISEQDARAKVVPEEGCPVKKQSSLDNNEETTAGYPVPKRHHPLYNVYSQPIDQTNNMPKVANQLPAPGQSVPLSTDRVTSTIPKVCRTYGAVSYLSLVSSD